MASLTNENTEKIILNSQPFARAVWIYKRNKIFFSWSTMYKTITLDSVLLFDQT